MRVYSQPELIRKWCTGKITIDIGGVGNADGAPHLEAINEAWGGILRLIVDCQEGAAEKIDLDRECLSNTCLRADIVWMAHTLEHLGYPLRVLRDLRQVANTLVVINGNPDCMVYRMGVELQRKRGPTMGHRYSWSAGDMRSLLHRAGWEVSEQVWQTGGWWSLLGAASRLAGMLYPPVLAYGYAMLCHKTGLVSESPYSRSPHA